MYKVRETGQLTLMPTVSVTLVWCARDTSISGVLLGFQGASLVLHHVVYRLTTLAPEVVSHNENTRTLFKISEHTQQPLRRQPQQWVC